MRKILYIALLLSACKDKSGTGSTDDSGTATDTGSTSATTCPATLRYAGNATGADSLDGVSVVGTFNDWEVGADPMAAGEDGWEITLDLAPGAYPYQLVEQSAWTYGEYQGWVCDPDAELIHCEDGYKEAWETDWSQDCTTATQDGPGSCNSLLLVEDCNIPQVELVTLDGDRATGDLSLTLQVTPAASGAPVENVAATVDGAVVTVEEDEAGKWSLDLSALAPGRHTIRVTATDTTGLTAEPLYIPWWNDQAAVDGVSFQHGTMYYAFVDRMANGDATNDAPEGASTELGDYMGGDWQGLLDLIPYLDDLGVTVLWISNPQSNADGTWDGQCDQTFTGYHAYWPDARTDAEDHFGTLDEVKAVVDAAHDRDMRVVMDWVANHVHTDHPYWTAHPEWFNEQAICEDSVGGEANWDRIPEGCWFAEYLPDIDYSQPEVLVAQVDDAIWWAQELELDGFRVDAAKHMPHSVQVNLQSRVKATLEHSAAGGDEPFWTVGETFDGFDRIAAYIGPDQLDGQFDFSLYYSVLDAFATEGTDLDSLAETAAGLNDGWLGVYDGAVMSNFLGNHDVMRFITYANQGYADACWDGEIHSAEVPDDWRAHRAMILAWAFLYTQPSIPLVYYGDEVALPGYTDPDDRQPLWWHVGDVSGGAVATVDDMLERVDDRYAWDVLAAVRALANARKDHPAMFRGTTVEWWSDPYDAADTYAYARVDETSGDGVLVVLNRSYDTASLSNSIGYAGFASGTTFTDVLSGESFTADGDTLSFTVDAYTARVLVAD